MRRSAKPARLRSEWLQRAGLGNPRRLGEILQVEAGWERAVETVLDGWLEAALVDDAVDAAASLASLESRRSHLDVDGDRFRARRRRHARGSHERSGRCATPARTRAHGAIAR